MEDLVNLAECMQQASAALVGDDLPEEPSGPAPVLQVVAIGASGVGKSAVLNSLFGHAILPTAEGGATRFPVLVDLQHDVNVKGLRANLGARTNMPTASEIRKAVQADMKRWVPSSASREEAHLTIKSSTAAPMRIVDLPGLDGRTKDVDNLIADNTSNNDAILLVVLAASNIKDSLRILRIAHDIDRDGTRTVGVITKLDAVGDDKSSITAAVEILQGQGPAMARDYPWVAVIGQPVGDKDTNDPLDSLAGAEYKTLSSVLRSAGTKGLDSQLGREALVRMLARGVRRKMKEKIPRIMSGLEGRSQEVESELLRLGESLISSLDGSRAVALELCRGFEVTFIDHLEGSEGGGSQMVEKFVGALPKRLTGLPLDRLFSMDNVKKVCTEADGYQPYLLSPEKGLRLLIKRTLELAKQPGLECVDEVHKILLDIVSASSNSAPSLIRFPPMKRELISIASAALDTYREEAKVMVTALVDMERVFIPPAHFIEAEARRQESIWRELDMVRKNMQERGVLPRRGSDAGDENRPGRLTSAMNSMMRRKDAPPPPPPSATPAVPAAPAAPLQELAGFLWKVSSKGGWSKRWFALSDKTARLYYVKKPDEKTPRGVIPLEDCVIDDVVAAEEAPPVSDSKGGTPGLSLSFKISNRVPYKTVVKVHHHLILRADNMAEKQQWVSRMRMLTKAGKEESVAAAAGSSADATAADGGEQGGKDKAADGDQGQPIGAVPPAPGQASNVSAAPPRRQMDPEEDLKYMAAEVRQYVQAVLHHLADNIPKAIVLTQVEKAKDAMLTKLYQAVSAKSDPSIAALLEEDSESRGKRERFRRMQETLMKLKRSLSLHEARASAEESNSESDKEAQTEDWRTAFSTPSIPEDEPSVAAPPVESPRKPSSKPQPSSTPPPRTSSGGFASSTSTPPQPARSSSVGLSPGPTQSPAPTTTASPSGGFFSRSSSTAPPPSSQTLQATSSMQPMRGPPLNPSGAPRNQSPLRGPLGLPGAADQGAGGPPAAMGAPMGRRRMPPPPPASSTPIYKYP